MVKTLLVQSGSVVLPMESHELGKLGEKLSRALLESKGYTILEQNWRFEKFEVDLIARFGHLLVFIEVKTRETVVFGNPETFVKRAKQLHLANAVEAYLYLNPEQASDVRYDVISVIASNKGNEAVHFEDAFWPDNLGVYTQDL